MKKFLTLICVLTSFLSFAQPSNDICASAQVITIPASGNVCITATNTGATNDGTITTCDTGPAGSEVWFTYIASGSSNTISVTPAAPGAASAVIVGLKASDCSSAAYTGCNAATGAGTATMTNGQTIGSQVWFSVSTNGTNGNFQVCVTSVTPPPLPGESCATATLYCSKEDFTYASFAGITASGARPSCFAAAGQKDVWLKFTVGTTGTLEFKASPNGNAEYDWALFDITGGCPGVQKACNYNTATALGGCGASPMGMSANPAGEDCPGEFNTPFTVVAGNTYAIIIDNYTGNNVGFDFEWGGTFQMAPTAGFTANPATSCVSPLTVTLTNTGTTATTYAWNFGDGTTFAGANPGTHVYSDAGTYLISLTTTKSGCTDVASQSVTINAPDLTVTPASTTICVGDPAVTLTATASPFPATYPLSFSNTTDAVISTAAGASSTITASGLNTALTAGMITSVCMNIQHQNNDQLDVSLIAPNGTTIDLSSDNGGSGNGFVNACFVPTGGAALPAGNVILTGSYTPEQPFTNLNGNPNGTWTLKVVDDVTAFNGTILDWTITFTVNNMIVSYSWSPTTGLTSTGISGTSHIPSHTTDATPASTTTYTVTATDFQGCSSSKSATITVTPSTTPTFTALTAVCQGAAAPALPGTSTNGITGTWAPASLSTASAGTVSSTFTPTAGQCATTAMISLTVNPLITPTFNALTSVCQNDPAPALQNPSNNGINGTWAPATLSTASAGTVSSTFTPTAGVCATTAMISLTINAPVTPTFNALTAVCQNDPAPALQNPSNNGFNGTWAPATLSTASAGTSSSTFTPTAGQCATTAMISLTVNAPVTPTFNALTAVCQNDPAPALQNPSNNGFSGTWAPATLSTASAGTSSSTFTPTAGQCATTAMISLTINAPITPTFNALTAVCQNDPAPALQNPSNNGFNGTWAPATLSTASPGTSSSTFTPTAGQCATTAMISLTINTPVTPTFNALTAVCEGDPAPALQNPSTNGYTGTWAPASLSTASAGTSSSTFTPTAGQCATTAMISLTVNPQITPTFNPIPPMCVGDTPPALPGTSTNGYTGTWMPATISTATAGTANYTFTPTAGQCATTAVITVTVGPPAAPTFNALTPVCEGDPAPALQNPSNNGVSGTWAPATLSTASAGTVSSTFTPDAGVCATTAMISLTINPPVTPTFNALTAVCEGDPAPALQNPSNNAISGTWAPATLSTATAGTVSSTFTPDAGVCATTAMISLTVNPLITPTFDALTAVCEGDPAPALQNPSTNGISGTWAPATLSTASAGTVSSTFTPTAGVCATTAMISLTVNPLITPTFNAIPPMCVGDTPPALQNPSNNSITGTWAPAAITTATAGTTDYTFTPTAGQCATTAVVTVTVGPPAAPTFNPLTAVCEGDPAPALQNPSNNGVSGTWAPATLSTASAGTVSSTFTPDAGICATTAMISLTVNPLITPTFSPLAAACQGGTAPALENPSGNGISGTWAPATLSTASAGTSSSTFTPDPGQCATTAMISITVNAGPVLVSVVETCNGTNTAYTVVVTLSGGDPASYAATVNSANGGPGSFAGNVWTSNPIPSGTAYDFDFDDINGCGPVNVSGMKNCACATSAGTMNLTPLSLCENIAATATHNGNHTLDADDVLGFILHSTSGGTLGTVYATSTTPNFSFSAPPLSYGVTYYISAIAGNNDGSGAVDITDPCLSIASGTPVVWNPIPVAVPANNGPVCVGTPLNLTSTTVAGATYSWTGPGGFSSSLEDPTIPSVTAANAGTYTLTVTANGCVSAPVNTTVVINQGPVIVSVAETCNGTNTAYTVVVTLSGGDPASYAATVNSASGGPGSFAGSVWTSNPIASGTAYDFDFDDINGCGPVNASGVKNCNCATQAGTMNLTPLSLCENIAATATHNGNHTLDANDVLGFILHSTSGATLGTVYATSTTPNFSFSNPPLSYGVTYYISAIAGDNDGSGAVDITDPCLSIASGTPVVWNPIPVAVPANNGPICEGQTLNLTAATVAGATYSWSGPGGYTSPAEDPSIASATVANAGTYTLTVTANGCVSTPVNTTVVINAPTTPTFTPLNAVCIGTPAPALQNPSGNGISGTWAPASLSTASAGSVSSTFTPNPGQCATTAMISMTVNPLPVIDAGIDQTICAGDPATLTATGGGPGTSYTWNNGVSNGVAFNPAATQTYTVTGTDGNGCSNTDQVIVTVNALPNVTGAATPAAVCAGQSTTLNGAGASTYAWDNGATNNVAFVPASTLTYTVTGTDANGCVNTATATVTVNPLPIIDAGPDYTICAGDPVTLTATGAGAGGSYSWNNGVSNAVAFNPSSTQTYTVTGTDANGCVGTDQAVVTVDPLPVANFSVNQMEAMLTDPVFIMNNQSTGAVTYNWTFGDGNTSTATSPTHAYDPTIGTYTITLDVYSAAGCHDVTQQTVVVKDELLFFVPNSFTPDGNEINNTFQPVFVSGYDPYDFSMSIYNRWGQVIFESHNVEIGWDGTYAGKLVQEGTYSWIMKVKDPQTDKKYTYRGHVNVLR